ncbi:hypothetical protein M409DRAFT_63287 [Zasmidium cellare ATCC 36951]|uniref:F-box domain-containing protein n=1 Tax=Zasmidium cellare ATCC 36951 TaxID=1080233 RepID=A0A6A6D206_ZASCE|nr:uncharacterized protein M409DRAFT_63287 [Zasmidium cellare ATCC 36951]KAF2171656.1 hypothetical protein M409DRAFT_63287 [Zasmidium cellare ATCC 36951]
METSTQDPQGIFRLPNEILLTILSTFPTKELLGFAPVCHQFHSLILRLIHHRLQIATTIDEHTLYLECGPPAAKLTTSKVFCKTLGTDCFEELSNDIQKTGGSVGQIGRMGQLFTRFRPVNKEPDFRSVPRPHPAGDIPGSNTYMTPEALAAAWKGDGNDTVSRTVSVDASFLFSQLETLAYLGKLGPRGLLVKYVEVCDGTIRVWRDWLARQCELKRWTDGEPIVIHQEPESPISKGKARADSVTSSIEPRKDPNILWVNTRGEDVGIKFRVKEQKWRRENPVLFASEIEVPVSYKVDLEEIVIRTTHLLLKLEESASQILNDTGKAMIFGSYLG